MGMCEVSQTFQCPALQLLSPSSIFKFVQLKMMGSGDIELWEMMGAVFLGLRSWRGSQHGLAGWLAGWLPGCESRERDGIAVNGRPSRKQAFHGRTHALPFLRSLLASSKSCCFLGKEEKGGTEASEGANKESQGRRERPRERRTESNERVLRRDYAAAVAAAAAVVLVAVVAERGLP
ncbi:hypothetical protein B296_00024291 [Ensete ventricosum]|uniref:Uncharacterized protein n=1 Tax=Ensete ventricosum TaxID=4639 RepID=A0A427ACY7_ENSVE|nr:hypothetical protein B296_00024291 [Ensete ventricosum]